MATCSVTISQTCFALLNDDADDKISIPNYIILSFIHKRVGRDILRDVYAEVFILIHTPEIFVQGA